MPACEMPLVANIITRSGSTSDADFRQHDGRAMVCMTFCRAVLFDEKKEVPAFAGMTAVGGFRGWPPRRGGRASAARPRGRLPPL